jgi:hypothetical protein
VVGIPDQVGGGNSSGLHVQGGDFKSLYLEEEPVYENPYSGEVKGITDLGGERSDNTLVLGKRDFENPYLVGVQVYENLYSREVRDITDLGREKAWDGGTVDEETVYDGHPGEEVHRDLQGEGAGVMVAISDEKLDLGEILERVPVGEADMWCSRMVIQPKKNGTARTVDLSGLSKVGRHQICS